MLVGGRPCGPLVTFSSPLAPFPAAFAPSLTVEEEEDEGEDTAAAAESERAQAEAVELAAKAAAEAEAAEAEAEQAGAAAKEEEAEEEEGTHRACVGDSALAPEYAAATTLPPAAVLPQCLCVLLPGLPTVPLQKRRRRRKVRWRRRWRRPRLAP